MTLKRISISSSDSPLVSGKNNVKIKAAALKAPKI
jgi:hypothetical protein